MNDTFSSISSQIICIFPELLLTLFVSIGLIINTRKFSLVEKQFVGGSIVAMLCASLLIFVYSNMRTTFSETFFKFDSFSYYSKLIVSICSLLSLLAYSLRMHSEKLPGIYPLLLVSITASLLFCISSCSLVSLLIGLEMYTFCLAGIFVTNKNDDYRYASCVRYLIFSTVMVALFIYGVSLIMPQLSTLSFGALAALADSFASKAGVVLIMCYVLFKLGAAPFHLWTLDVYKRLSFLTILFLESVTKPAVILILMSVVLALTKHSIVSFKGIFVVVSILSMIIGSYGAIFEKNVKKFIAYSSISNIGLALSVFASSNYQVSLGWGVVFMFTYLAPASVLILSFISCESYAKIKTFNDLRGIRYANSFIALCLFLSLFAIAGLPPFFGFLSKIKLFEIMIIEKNYAILIAAIIQTIFTIVYTLKVITFIFSKGSETLHTSVTKNINAIHFSLLALMTLGTLFFDKFSNALLQIVQ